MLEQRPGSASRYPQRSPPPPRVHTFGSIAINLATIVRVQAWMGHSDVDTTMKYMHHRSRASDARLLSAGFQPAKKKAARRSARRKRPTAQSVPATVSGA